MIESKGSNISNWTWSNTLQSLRPSNVIKITQPCNPVAAEATSTKCVLCALQTTHATHYEREKPLRKINEDLTSLLWRAMWNVQCDYSFADIIHLYVQCIINSSSINCYMKHTAFLTNISEYNLHMSIDVIKYIHMCMYVCNFVFKYVFMYVCFFFFYIFHLWHR